MHEFTIGQRWVSAGELHLGVGLVLAVEHRTVSIIYPATGETRVYAKQSAPLSRVAFAVGDDISDQDGREMVVDEVEHNSGLLIYHCSTPEGDSVRLSEGKLNNFLKLNQPAQRLVNGQIDHNKWFELRARVQKISSLLEQSPMHGLTGCRTSLIDHQLYIAHEVASRYAPRVLLADEVGLGKTIEAGLIIHQQLLRERAARVLVVTPESLVHQWMVEMMRRFNLLFSVFDEERCEALDGSHDEDLPGRENPFHSEQLVLCSLEFLANNPQRFGQSLDGEWDMLVVDEAHHLVWEQDDPSMEYQLVEQLARKTRSVLLLTATPEQLGKQSHFARLRLLDHDRFSDLEHFIDEERHYGPVAEIVEALMGNQPLDAAQMDLLQQTVGEGDNLPLIEHIADIDEVAAAEAREKLVDHLLDRHGTGRVLFRNTRHMVEGFPERRLVSYALECPAPYREMYAALSGSEDLESMQALLSAELLFQQQNDDSGLWGSFDPRVEWLRQFLLDNRADKVLVICHSAQTVISLAQRIKADTGMVLAAFHEGLSLIERDRAAAWFADQDGGAPAMICSEIGSEGRNFQFSHHLVMFDLPANPDLLEQRIGRLDRIGQAEVITIHVPYLKDTAQQVMLNWLHQGLDAFERTCPAGHNLFMQSRHELMRHLLAPGEEHGEFYARSAALHRELDEQIQKGRDRLLEFNSCRPARAQALTEEAESLHQKLNLPKVMEQLYDCYGISHDIHSPGRWALNPTDNMLAPVPGLPEDGMTVTYDRGIALANEDVRFLTWEHPFVRTLMDMVMSSELGNTALLAIRYPHLKPGSLMLDCFFRVDVADSHGDKSSAEGRRYLPDNLIRICIDERGERHEARLTPDAVARGMQLVERDTSIKVVKSREQVIKALLERAQKMAEAQLPARQAQAMTQAEQVLQNEADRLLALQTINPNVRDDEIEFFRGQLEQTRRLIEQASIRLDAIRVMVSV
jgi:ATP-dependent helicase HepA